MQSGTFWDIGQFSLNAVVDTNIKVVQVKGGLEQIHWMKGFLLNH